MCAAAKQPGRAIRAAAQHDAVMRQQALQPFICAQGIFPLVSLRILVFLGPK